MLHDVRLALRMLRVTPVVSAVAILSLALGIGANTAIFSLVDSLILKALPVPPARQLALMVGVRAPRLYWSNPVWEALDRRAGPFAGALAWSARPFVLARGGESPPVDGLYVSGDYFKTLEVPALVGRMLTRADDRRGGGPDGAVAVISYAFWQRRYGGAATAVGSPLVIEGAPFTIVGVTPPDFFGTEVGKTFDVAVPLGTEALIRGRGSVLDERRAAFLSIMVRLQPGQSIEAATTALRAMQPQIRDETVPPQWQPQFQAQYLADPLTLERAAAGTSTLRTRYREPLLIILSTVGLVLLIACANIANLLLARAAARRHELSVRLALGASRWHLARQLLVESLLLAALGAALGFAFATWSSRLIVAQLSTDTSRVFLDLAPDWRMFGFMALATVGATALFGTVPAFRAAGNVPQDALKEQIRGTAAEGRVGLSSGLVVTQVALSLVLVVAAGLLVRTFMRLSAVRLGFEPSRVLVVPVNNSRARVSSSAFYASLAETVRAMPGVERAAVSIVTPVSGLTLNDRVMIPDAPQLSDADRTVMVNFVTPDWFATYRTSILEGRDVSAGDTAEAPPVALVNQALARKMFAGRSPLNRSLVFIPEGRPGQPAPPKQIVGVVADALYRSMREPVPPTLYLPIAQWKLPFGLPSVSVSLRAAAAPSAALTREIADALTRLDPNLAFTFRPIDDQVRASLTQERLVAMLSGFFGALALLLAALGLYGVTSYAVARRRTEIGIRMALGAAPERIVRLMLGRLVTLIGVGAAIGVGASWWASRFVASLLYGLEPRDPATLAGAVGVLGVVGIVAGWLPVRRASRIDPAEVLREA